MSYLQSEAEGSIVNKTTVELTHGLGQVPDAAFIHVSAYTSDARPIMELVYADATTVRWRWANYEAGKEVQFTARAKLAHSMTDGPTRAGVLATTTEFNPEPTTVVGPYESVTDYGAVGDGVTDDTLAIQAALDAAGASGKACYFPPGTYAISDTLLVEHSGMRIIGAGCGVSTLKVHTLWTVGPRAGALVGAFIAFVHESNVTGNDDTTRIEDLEIAHLGFDGTGTVPQTLVHPKAIAAAFADHVTIRDCRFANFGNETIWPSGPAIATHGTYWHITGNVFDTCGNDGVTAGAPSVVNANLSRSTISGNRFYSCYGSIGLGGYYNIAADNVIVNGYGFGISTGDDSFHTIVINNNTVQMSTQVLANAADSCYGIAVIGAGSKGVAVNGNTVRLTAHATSPTGASYGILVAALTAEASAAVNGNTVILDANTLTKKLVGISTEAQAGQTCSATVSGNHVRLVNRTGASIYHTGLNGYIYTSGTVRVLASNNYLDGFTIASGDFAIDFNQNGGGTMQAHGVGNVVTDGRQRFNATMYSTGAENNIPVFISTVGAVVVV